MAREGYLVGAGEDSIHANEIKLETKKDKRKNWWHYNKFKVIAILVAVLLIFSFIYSIVSKVEPDYQIALINSYAWSEELKLDLEDYIEQYADDRNEDGQVVVSINEYSFSSNDTTGSTVQASIVRMSTDILEQDSVIFIHDAAGFDYMPKENYEGLFLYNDGSRMPEGKLDYENAMLNWNDVLALKNYSPPEIEGYGYEIASDEIEKMLGMYRVSVRSASQSTEKKEKKHVYYEDSLKLYERLRSDEKYKEG